MTLFFLLNPVKNISGAASEVTPLPGGWCPDVREESSDKKKRKIIAKLRAKHNKKALKPKDIQFSHVPKTLARQLKDVSLKSERKQLIKALKQKLLELYQQQLLEHERALIEEAAMLRAWEEIQDEMLIMFMFTEGEA